MKPARVRFYFDADLMGLGKTIASLRPDCTFPGDPGAVVMKRQRAACPVPSQGVLDTEWIPIVAEKNWLIITRDAHIQRRTAERRAVVEHGGRMVALASKHAGTRWAQLELFMSQWRGIEKLAEKPGPFIYTASRTSLRRIDL